MNERSRKLLAVYLSTIMVFSVFATVTFTGPVAASTNSSGDVSVGTSPSANVPDATIDPSSDSKIPVAINVEDEGISRDNIYVQSLNDTASPPFGLNNESLDAVNISGLSGEGNVTIPANSVAEDFTLDVEAYDVSTDPNSPITGASDTSTITVSDSPPTITDVNITEGNFKNMKISFNSSEQLGPNTGDISVSVDGPNTNNVYTFDGDQISQQTKSSPYTYQLFANQLFTDGTGTYTVTIDTAKDLNGNDGGSNSLTDTYDYTSNFSSKTIKNQAGGPDLNASNVSMMTNQFGSQFVFVRLENSTSGFARRDLSGEGATSESELWVNFTVDEFNPDVLMGTANVQRWNYTMNADGSANVNVSLKPASIERNFTAWNDGVFQPSNWGDKYDGSDKSMDAVVDFGIGNFSAGGEGGKEEEEGGDGGGGPQGLDGARLTTDAQAYTVPKLDDNKNLTVDVASPHCKANASSPKNQCSGGTVNDDGFYEAVIPSDFYQQEWNVSELSSDEVDVQYSANESAAAETQWNITIRNDGAMVLNGTNIHYSTGTINVVDQTGSNDGGGGDGGTSSTGGGGGGGGLSDPDNPEVTTTQTETGTEATIKEVAPGATVSVDVSDASTDTVSVTEASATFEKGSNVENTMSISASTSPPSDASPAPDADRVLSYVTVDVKGSLANDVSEGRFTIDVSGSGVDPESVTAHRYDGSEWQEVETQALDETTVEVVSPDGYSPFAIGSSENPESEEPTATQTPVETETPTATAEPLGEETSEATLTPTVAVDAETPESTAAATPTPTPGAGGPGFGLLVALVALLAVLARVHLEG